MSKGSQATAPSIWTGARSVPEAEAFIAAILKHVRRKLPFLAIWIGAFIACGLFYATVVKPEYIATAQILLQPRVIVNDGPEDLRHFYQLLIDGEQCETELRVLSSEQLLYRVFKALNLERSAEIRTGPDGFWSYLGAKVDQIERIVAPKQESLQAFYAFSDRVRSRRLGLSYVIEISYRAQSAKRATTVVNSIASAYAAYRLRGALAREQRRGVYLEGRLIALQKQIMAAEAGMRFGTVPENPMADSGVRLLGPAGLPLGSLYPKLLPILALAVLLGGITGLLIVLMPYAAPAGSVSPRSSSRYLPQRVRSA